MRYLILILLISQNLIAGGESSGGSDYYLPTRAWFLTHDTTKKVIVCFDTASDFGVGELELIQMVEAAFKSWGDYITAKKLTMGKASNVRIASQIDIVRTCTGKEDLKFYFGTSNATVAKALAQYDNPFGFAELLSNQKQQPAWSPGFIWIAASGAVFPKQAIPAWSASKGSLAALILHEVGHVFGNGHVDDTVMTVHLAELLTIDTNPSTPMASLASYSRIDSNLDLIPCLNCSTTYHAPRQFSGEPFAPGSDDLSDAFRLLTGEDPVEPLSAFYTGTDFEHSMIVFKDGDGEQRFPVTVHTYAGGKKDSTLLFNGLADGYYQSFGAVYFGELRPKSGDPITVSISYNMDRRKLVIKPVGLTMYPNAIFVAKP